MTTLLQQALEKVSELRPEQRDQIVEIILAEMGSHQKWNRLFSESPDLLEQMADQALEEHRKGLSKKVN